MSRDGTAKAMVLAGVVAFACVTGGTVRAQEALKCIDDRGHITYSNIPCEKQGLRHVGTVPDRMTTVPGLRDLKPPAPAAPAARDEGDAGAKPPAGPPADEPPQK